MIEPNRYFFEEVDSLYAELNKFTTKDDLFNACVTNRFTDILNLQTHLFDSALNEFDKTLDFEFSDIDSIRKLSYALKKLHKIIAHDRMCIIKHLISIHR